MYVCYDGEIGSGDFRHILMACWNAIIAWCHDTTVRDCRIGEIGAGVRDYTMACVILLSEHSLHFYK